MIFTTSWDDGHPLDLRVADMLRAHGMTGTFYIAGSHPRVPTAMAKQELRLLGEGMEIGAHTLTHPLLTQIPIADAAREIKGSKEWLEDVLQKPCDMFCYPRGEWNGAVKDAVRDAGFKGARTTEVFAFASNTDPFLQGSTIHLYHFPFRPVANRRFADPLRRAWPHLNELDISMIDRRSWGAMAKAVFRTAHAGGRPWFHLRGHSWEVENLGMWKELDGFLAFVASRENVTFGTNGSLIRGK